SKSSMRRNLAIKADVLEGFYRDPAAAKLLDDAAARRRLADVALAAARAALRDRHVRSADAMAHRALSVGGSRRRAFWTIGMARTLSMLGLDREPQTNSVGSPAVNRPAAG